MISSLPGKSKDVEPVAKDAAAEEAANAARFKQLSVSASRRRKLLRSPSRGTRR